MSEASTEPISFRQIFDRMAIGAMTLIGVYAATQLRDLSKSVGTLNTNMAVFAAQMVEQKVRQDRIEDSVRGLETRMVFLETSSGVWQGFRMPANKRK
jgi:hypothetical protein